MEEQEKEIKEKIEKELHELMQFLASGDVSPNACSKIAAIATKIEEAISQLN